MDMNKQSLHASHPDIVKRLKRADGHIRNVIEMIDSGRSCLDITQQLHAVEQAIGAAKKALIHDHVDHCLELLAGGADRDVRRITAEFKGITKYL
jgi:DNA-binding FrmR family transcriptional regulator